ncbi:tRNA (N6-threonylcarbamoyladenosine(37)-N6)-methyltransferase TrmO [Chloroflexota bacterium]
MAGSKMSAEPRSISLKAIGTVINGIHEPPEGGWSEVTSDIVIAPGLAESLDNLDEFSHIIVLFWMHRAIDREPKRVHPMGNRGLPLVGLFASRSPYRPNPLGKTTVRLLGRRGNTLKVRGLDAVDGTPVVDIKPYIPGYDTAAEAKVPPWVTEQ